MSRPARDGLEWIDDEAEEGAQPRPCRVMIAGLPMRESFTDQQITELFVASINSEVISSKVLYTSEGRSTGVALVKLRSWLHAKEAYTQLNGRMFDGAVQVRIFILTDPSDPPPGFILRLLNGDQPAPIAGPGPSTRAQAQAQAPQQPHPPKQQHQPAPAAKQRTRAHSPEIEIIDVKPRVHELGSGGGAGRAAQGKKRAGENGLGPRHGSASPSTVSLLSRISVDLKDRIGGKTGHGVGASISTSGNSPSEQAVLLARQRLRKARATGSAPWPKDVALARKHVPGAGPTGGVGKAKLKAPLKPGQARASNVAPASAVARKGPASKGKTVQSKGKGAVAAAGPPSGSTPAGDRAFVPSLAPPPKTQAQLDEELARYNRARKWGGDGATGAGRAPGTGGDVVMDEAVVQSQL